VFESDLLVEDFRLIRGVQVDRRVLIEVPAKGSADPLAGVFRRQRDQFRSIAFDAESRKADRFFSDLGDQTARFRDVQRLKRDFVGVRSPYPRIDALWQIIVENFSDFDVF